MNLHPLDSATAKIQRAQENIANLNAEIGRFLKDTQAATQVYPDKKTGERIVVASGRTKPPLRFAVLAGEIVHHLRSALNHVAYQLVLANGHTPSTRTEFPIFVTLDEYEARHPPKVQGMSGPAKTLIESLQPFQRGHPKALDHQLWLIHEMDRR